MNAVKDDEKILTKIAALLSKTMENGCTEAEAITAQAKANELIIKHKIDERRLRSTGSTCNIGEQILKVNPHPEVERHFKQKYCLASTIARNNFCRILIDGGNKNHLILIGNEHDREIVVYLYYFLIGEMFRFGQETFRKEPGHNDFITWYASFAFGFNDRLSERLHERRDALLNTELEKDCKAIVVMSDQDVEEAMHRMHPFTRSRNLRGGFINPAAYASGIAAANKAAVNPAMKS